MNNDKETYQLICDKLLERYELECEVREIYAGACSIYVKNFDIQCKFENMSAPVVYCADYVASCCYKIIPKHYTEFIEIYTKKGGR